MLTTNNLSKIKIDSIILQLVQAQLKNTKNSSSIDDIISALEKFSHDNNKHLHVDTVQKLADDNYKILKQLKLYDTITELCAQFQTNNENRD